MPGLGLAIRTHWCHSFQLAASDVRYASQQAELEAGSEATLAIETRALMLHAEAVESANALVKAQQRAKLQDGELGAAQTMLATLTDRVDQLEQALQLAQTIAKANANLHDHMAADLRREREALVAVRAMASQRGLGGQPSRGDRTGPRKRPLARRPHACLTR